MGMFDTVRSGYPIFGLPFDQELQTKDLMCVMAQYWISPAGELFDISYQNTSDLWVKEPEFRKNRLDMWEWRSNGNHGRVMFTPWWGVAEMYPAKWEGTYEDMPSALVYFRDGKIEEIRIDTPSGWDNLPW